MKFVKIASLVVGILLMILAGIGAVVSLLLPSLTDNHVSFDEAIFVLIPSIVIFFIALLLTIVSAILLLRKKKTAA